MEAVQTGVQNSQLIMLYPIIREVPSDTGNVFGNSLKDLAKGDNVN